MSDDRETITPPAGPLRRGWTTGACATAAASAAYSALVTGDFPDPVAVRLPNGQTPSFALARSEFDGERALAAVVKDAGDDPDVTHGALIVVRVERGPVGSGIVFYAGEGVGTVTLPGLALAVGEPAINAAPRRMMREAIESIVVSHGDPGDVTIEISVPGGETMAKRTLNGRLGIVGGLSILGTTGIVVPYSCSAWIHSIHRGIDVAHAAGHDHIAAATGSTSEAAVRTLLDLPETALIDMGDFAGGVLKYLRAHPIPRLTIAGGFAKLAKLGQGLLDLHSGRSTLDMAWLADRLRDVGGNEADVALARDAVSAGAILSHARTLGLPLADAVAARARRTAAEVLGGAAAVDIIVFDRTGTLIGRA